MPKSYAGSLQVALSTQTTTHTAQQPLNGLRTALKKISRSVNSAFSAVPVAKFEQQTAAAAVSANCNLVRRTEKGRLRRRGWGLRWEKAQKGGKGTNLRGFFED